MSLIASILCWVAAWLYYVAVVLFAGAFLGALVHLAVGLAFLDAPDPLYLAAFGFLNGLKFAGLWAGGLAIVLCFMRAHRQRTRRPDPVEEAPAS